MDRASYYEEMKRLAHEVRQQYGVTTSKVGLKLIRWIYKEEGIELDYWRPKLRKVRAAYFIVDGAPCVLLNAGIKPKEPRIFALCHELKHHYVDRQRAESGGLSCQHDVSWRDGSPIEIGAEMFAAEFIFTEAEFVSLARNLGLDKRCLKEDVVRLKRESPAPVSYTFIRKRLQWLGLAKPGEFDGIQFQKLEDELYGVPFFRRVRRRQGVTT